MKKVTEMQRDDESDQHSDDHISLSSTPGAPRQIFPLALSAQGEVNYSFPFVHMNLHHWTNHQ